MFVPLIDPNGKKFYLYHNGWGGLGHVCWIPLFIFASKVGFLPEVDYHLCLLPQSTHISRDLISALDHLCIFSPLPNGDYPTLLSKLSARHLPVSCPPSSYLDYVDGHHHRNLFIAINHWMGAFIESGLSTFLSQYTKLDYDHLCQYYSLDSSRPLVLFHIRDTPSTNPSLRNCDPHLYQLAISQLSSSGYNVIRFGYGRPVFEHKLPPNFIDLCKYWYFDHTLALVSLAHYYVGVCSGPVNLRALTGKHCLLTNIPDALVSLAVHPYPDFSFRFRSNPYTQLTESEIYLSVLEYINSPLLSDLQGDYWLDPIQTQRYYNDISSLYGYTLRYPRISSHPDSLSRLNYEIKSSLSAGISNC